MRTCALLCCLFLCSSCSWFSSKQTKTEQQIEVQLKEVDMNDIDQYPLFDNCNELATKEEQKICFENTLINQFSKVFQAHEFTLDKDLKETVYIDFLIDNTGAIFILKIDKSPQLAQQIPNLDAIVKECLKGVPFVEPALKRGIPVSAKFRIPLAFNTP